MIAKKHFGKIINLGINIVLGIALTLTGLLKNGIFTPSAFATGFVVSMGVGYLICDIIPAADWGAKLTDSIKNPVLHNLLCTAITGLVYILCISFCNIFVSSGFAVMMVWPGTFPVLYLVGYVVLLIFMPVITKIAQLLTD